jgi:hypothetical protein
MQISIVEISITELKFSLDEIVLISSGMVRMLAFARN